MDNPNNPNSPNNSNPAADTPQATTNWPPSQTPVPPEPVTTGEPVPTFMPQPAVPTSDFTGDLSKYPLQPNSAGIDAAQTQSNQAESPLEQPQPAQVASTPSLSQSLQSHMPPQMAEPPNQSTFNPESIAPTSPADSGPQIPTIPPSDIPQPPASEQTQPTQFESAPTDLSHLVTNTNDFPQTSDINQPAVPTSENLLIQPSVNPDVPNIPGGESHKGIPKWLIGVGVGLLLMVIGTSAFFILGVGQPSQTTSLPATQAPKSTPKPAPTTTSQKTPQPSGASGFGQFEATPSAAPSVVPTTKPATSAADLLKQRR